MPWAVKLGCRAGGGAGAYRSEAMEKSSSPRAAEVETTGSFPRRSSPLPARVQPGRVAAEESHRLWIARGVLVPRDDVGLQAVMVRE